MKTALLLSLVLTGCASLQQAATIRDVTDHIKADMGTDPGHCLPYAIKAQGALIAAGIPAHIRIYDCHRADHKLHAVAQPERSNIVIESDLPFPTTTQALEANGCELVKER